jgi:hypothetical protein
MSKIKEVIRIRVIETDEEKKTEKVELLIRGGHDVLTSLVYSTMMSAPNFSRRSLFIWLLNFESSKSARAV